MKTARILWGLSVLLMTIGLIVLGLAVGAGAETSYDFCTDGGERGVVTLDGTCMTPTAYAAEFGDGVNVAFYPDQGFQSFEEWLITLGGVEMYEAYRAAGHVLTVDGVTYSPTKVVGSGPTVHYETPDVQPTSAFSERHVWEGHGSENLPCEGGIHWIDNKNVLTISHCLPNETSTTTTVPPVTTTSTVVPSTTTTSTPPTTTPPSTCDETNPLWNPSSQTCELPLTGVDGDVLRGVFFVGLMALVLGGVLALVGGLIGRR